MIARLNDTAVVDADAIPAAAADTLWGLFSERTRRSPHAVAYQEYEQATQTWRDYTWQAVARRVDRFRTALAREDLAPGDRVAVLLPNGIDWVCLDLAAQGSGLVVVGLYPNDMPANNAFILGHSGARLLLVDTEEQWRALAPLRSEFPLLERIWIRRYAAALAGSLPKPVVHSLADALAAAADSPSPHPAAPDDLATLIYTSGTTGRPKGVMLSHFALLWNAEATAKIIPTRHDDVFVSVLPLAHAFERTVGYYLAIMGGCTVAYARSAQDLRADLIALRATVMLGVPVLYERMGSAIRANVSGRFLRHALLCLAAFIGWRRFAAIQRGTRSGLAVWALWPLLKQIVTRPVLAAFGGRLRVAVCGGAPLDPRVAHLLIGLGLPLIEGYGLTEAAPVVAANGLDDNLPGSVGAPLPGVEVKVSPQGELLVRTPSIMKGYWKDTAETTRALDAAGWLATGDAAEIKDGRIYVRDRIKETIVLSIGEKINPDIVETELTRDPLFAQAMVVGDRRPFLAAIVVLNAAVWRRLCAGRRLDPEKPEQEVSKAELQDRIRARLTGLPKYAQVRALHPTLQPWTVEAGLLTPSLKIKRGLLQQLFTREIEALYA